MSNRSWVADALLGSPTPPPRWLDPRNAGTGWTAPWAGYWSQHMHVPAGYIQEELRALWTCVNPPIVQGWAWCLALAGVVVTLLGLDRLSHSSVMDGPTLLMVLAPIPVWFAAILAGGFFSHDVELREGEVCVRRWTDVWFGGKGRVVGPVATMHAVLSCGNHLYLAGDAGVVVVSLALWPDSSRQALEERFERWGVELEFPGKHHVDHPAHWNHGHHRIAHQLPEQGQHTRQGGFI